MKISIGRHRSESNPLEGVRLTAAEARQVADLARALAASDVPDDDIRTMRTALARHALYLEEAGIWTEAGTRTDAERQAEHERTLILCEAARTAPIVRRAV